MSPPPPPRVSLVVKGNKKGSHAEAVDGESSRLAASGWRKGLRTAAPQCCCLSWGLVKSPLGVLASWRGSIPSMPLPLALSGGSRGFCSPGLLLARATISPNLLLPASCLLEEMLHPADFLPPSLSSLLLLLVGIPES